MKWFRIKLYLWLRSQVGRFRQHVYPRRRYATRCTWCGAVTGETPYEWGTEDTCEPCAAAYLAGVHETDAALDALLERCRTIEVSQAEREDQALDFAYGNLSISTNHKPDRETFRKLARERYGWDDARFDAWAAARDGWRNTRDE